MSDFLWPRFGRVYRHAAGYVDRILKGEKPADLPESLLTQMNLRTEQASALNFERRLAAHLESREPMCLLFTGIEQSPPAALNRFVECCGR